MSIDFEKNDSFDVVLVRNPYDLDTHFRNNTESNVLKLNIRLSTYTHNPISEYWKALHRLRMYLKSTIEVYLHFNKFSVVLKWFCDVI